MSNVLNNVSVIIPAFNEEKHIGHTITALKKHNDLDIILVNNGSTDRTAEIAGSLGAKVIDCPSGTIAAVRNRGVEQSSADVLVFIDADVIVSDDWHQLLPDVVKILQLSPMTVTGSRVQTSDTKNWINKYWYSQLLSYDAAYINSGHLITSRLLFNTINGFNEALETAEDYDFCQRAVKAGAQIKNNAELLVIHEGYPTSLSGFITRERWHGSQDVKSWQLFLASKIAWIAALNLLLFIASSLFMLSGFYAALIIYAVVMYLIVFVLNIYKFGMKRTDFILIMPVLFYFYLCGRSLALVDKLTGSAQK